MPGDVNKLTDAEWQYMGNSEWWFGIKVRGLIRDPLFRMEKVESWRGNYKWTVCSTLVSNHGWGLLETIEEVEEHLGVIPKEIKEDGHVE